MTILTVVREGVHLMDRRGCAVEASEEFEIRKRTGIEMTKMGREREDCADAASTEA